MTKVGFIGLGIMGLTMAINFKNDGIELMVNDLNHQSVRQMTDLGADVYKRQSSGYSRRDRSKG